MIHEQCKKCIHCAWVAIINGKWLCECARKNFWGTIEENNENCENYLYSGWEKDIEE